MVQNHKLIGAIEHTGNATNEGHYVAYVKDRDTWIEWNDENKTKRSCE